MIAAFFLDFFEIDERLEVLNNRLRFFEENKRWYRTKIERNGKTKSSTIYYS